MNVTNIHNTYNETVINNVSVTKVSYNGGPGGTAAAPSAQERAWRCRSRTCRRRRCNASTSKRRRAIPRWPPEANGGHPAIAATPKPAAFNAPGVVGARGAAPMGAAQLARTNGPAAGGAGSGAPRVNYGNAPHASNGNLRPGAQPSVTHVPPNAAVHAQGAAPQPGAKPQAAKPPAPKAQQHPPKDEKHQEGGNR